MIGNIEKSKKVLCSSCGTKKYIKVIGKDKSKDYGIIVIHKKDTCLYMKNIIENSIEVK